MIYDDTIDLNDAVAPPPADDASLQAVPSGVIAGVKVRIEDNGDLVPTKKRDGFNLRLTMNVSDGPYQGRTVREWWLLKSDHHDRTSLIKANRHKLRQMIESAFGIDPNDMSPQAKQRRVIASYAELQGIEPYALFRAPSEKNGKWYSRIERFITPADATYPSAF